MADLRLQDIGWIIAGLALIASVRVLYAYRAEVGMFCGAMFRRYIAVGDWRAAMDRLADERYSVKGYTGTDTGSGSAPDGSIPPIPPLVLPLSDAVNTGTIIPVPEDLSRSALLDILARQKIDNKYVFSGNKLVDLFASTPHAASRNAVLEEIAKIRKDDEPAPKKPTARLERPAEGW